MTNKRDRERTARLTSLMDEAGPHQADFCKRVWPREEVDANKAKVSKWKKGTNISSSEAELVAQAFNRRPAWVLWGELPEHAGQKWPDAKLETELATRVATEVARQLDAEASQPLFSGRLHADGGALLAAIIEDERRSFQQWREWTDQQRSDKAFLGAVAELCLVDPEAAEKMLRKRAATISTESEIATPPVRQPNLFIPADKPLMTDDEMLEVGMQWVLYTAPAKTPEKRRGRAKN